MFQITRPLRCIALCPHHALNPVRAVLIAKDRGSDDAVDFVVLNVFPGGRTYLAALADQRDRIIEWLEVWVQSTHDLDASPLTRVALMGNASHDRQWLSTAESMRNLNRDSFIETDWEIMSGVPLVADLRGMTLVRLVEAGSKSPLELCRDDSILKAAGLGAYSTTLERWFYARSPAGALSWFSLQDLLARDSGEHVAIPESGPGIPAADFNLGAGLMLLRKHNPVSVEGFLGWLSGRAGNDEAADDATDGSPAEREVLRTCRRPRDEEQASSADSILESAFHRVQLWCSMAREIQALSVHLRTPLLNLTTDSFRISPDIRPSLLRPVWPFRTDLVQPGDAVAIKIGDSEVGFAPLRGTLSSPYALQRFGGFLEGSGTMRIRQVVETGDGGVRLEGILDGNEIRNVSAGGIVWVQTPIDGRSISFFAKIEADKGGTRAGVGFLSPSVNLTSSAANRLKSTARLPCQFVVVRPVNPVFDTYSLGVIGVRIFLTDDPQSVTELVDDLFELSALLPAESSIEDLRRLAGTKELGERLQRLLVPPAWAMDASGGFALSGNVWFAILRELIEFVTVEVPSELGEGESIVQPWLDSLTSRLHSLEQVAAQVGRLLVSPRADHDEVARVVHSFV